MGYLLAMLLAFLFGYFVIGEFIMGTLCGCGRNHHYPWERKERKRGGL